MPQKKRRLHNCFNHPGKKARGRCSRCGKWICYECAVLYKGNLYCALSCTPSVINPRPTITTPEVIQKKANEKGPTKKWLVIWAAFTLAFLGAGLGTWAMREVYFLKQENSTLRENRLRLIDHLKRSNSEIMSLKEELRTFSAMIPGKTDSLKPVLSRKNDNSMDFTNYSEYTDDGFPLSFNNGSTDQKLVSITFDAGSMANAADEILDTLRSRNVRTTMFLTGEFIRKYPELVSRIAEEGHELGNHTLTHPRLTTWAQDRTHALLPGVNKEFISRQLSENENLLLKKTGLRFSPLWRAPYGEFNRTICRWALQSGYLHIGWRQGRTWSQNLDSNDWIPDENTPGFKTPEQVLEKILALSETKPHGINGGIILMHLGTERVDRSKQVHRVLGVLIDRLRENGYRIVSVSEMVNNSGLNLAHLTPKSHIPVSSLAKKDKE